MDKPNIAICGCMQALAERLYDNLKAEKMVKGLIEETIGPIPTGRGVVVRGTTLKEVQDAGKNLSILALEIKKTEEECGVTLGKAAEYMNEASKILLDITKETKSPMAILKAVEPIEKARVELRRKCGERHG
jgi:hypothetical protein